jgi:drug/metabolite transporter (DMT)-like permease
MYPYRLLSVVSCVAFRQYFRMARVSPVSSGTEFSPTAIPTTQPVETDSPTKSTLASTAAGFNGLDLALILTMTLWSGNVVISKAATDSLPPMAYNALRFTIAPIAMYLMLRWRKFDFRLPRALWPSIVLSALFNYTLYQLAFINGLHQTTAGNNALIMAAGPAWVAIINAARSQERITRGALLGAFLALFGVVVVVIGRESGTVGFGGSTLTGDVLTLFASFFWAFGVLASRHALTRDAKVPNLTITFWVMVVGSLSQIAFGAVALSQVPLTSFTPSVIVALLYSGSISVALGSLIFNYAIGKRGATRTAVFSYMQPLITGGLAILFLGESLSAWLLVGGVLIFAGVALVRRT